MRKQIQKLFKPIVHSGSKTQDSLFSEDVYNLIWMTLPSMAIRVVEFSSGGYRIGNIFA